MKDRIWPEPGMRSVTRFVVLMASAAVIGCGGDDGADSPERVEESSSVEEPAAQQAQYHEVTREAFQSIKLGEGLEHVEEIMGGPGEDTLGRGISFKFISEPNAHGSQERVSVYLTEAGGVVDQAVYKYEFNSGNESAVEKRRNRTLENIDIDLESIRETRSLDAINQHSSVGYRFAERELHDNGVQSSVYAFGQGLIGNRERGYAMVFHLTDGHMYSAVQNRFVED